MRIGLAVATVHAMGALAIADSNAVLYPSTGVRHATYQMGAGQLTPTPYTPAPSIWNMTIQSGRYFGSMDAQPFHDLGARVMDWGDIAGDQWVGGFEFAYGTDLSTPIAIDCEIVFYGDYNGWNSNGRNSLSAFYFPELPAATGGYNSWIITVDLEADPNDPNAVDQSFRITSNDLDGDGMADFGYSYWFPSLSGLDSATGPLVTNPDLSAYPDVEAAEAALGIEDAYDLFLAHPSVPDVFVYDGTFWLDGWNPNDPNSAYAQFYMALFPPQDYACVMPGASGLYCSADIDGSGDCMVGLADLSTLLANYGASGGAYPGDIDPAGGDGDVDLADLAVMLAQYGDDCDS